MMRVVTYTISATALLIVAGCGGAANEYDSVVTGTVTIDGDLAESGTVIFHPVEGGVPAIGRIHTDGSYSLRTGQGNLKEVDGGTVKSGDYVITVSINGPPVESEQKIEGAPPLPGPSLVAARYGSNETSDLKQTVKAGNQVIVLELEGAEPVIEEESQADPSAEEGAPAAEVGAAPSAETGGAPQPAGDEAPPGDALPSEDAATN